MVEALIPIDALEKTINDHVLDEGKFMNIVMSNIRGIVAKEIEKKEKDAMMEKQWKELSKSDSDERPKRKKE